MGVHFRPEGPFPGKIKATWFVVPGSGTGDLSRLRRGRLLKAFFGKGADATPDYWLE